MCSSIRWPEFSNFERRPVNWRADVDLSVHVSMNRRFTTCARDTSDDFGQTCTALGPRPVLRAPSPTDRRSRVGSSTQDGRRAASAAIHSMGLANVPGLIGSTAIRMSNHRFAGAKNVVY
jgi:hypothetical protein